MFFWRSNISQIFASTQKLLRVTMVKAGAVLGCAAMQTSDCDKIVTGATLHPPRLSALIQVDTSLALPPGLMSHYITQVRGKTRQK